MSQPSPPGGGIGGGLNAGGLAGTNAAQMNALRAALAQQLANQPGAANSNVVASAGFLNNSALKGFDDIKKSLNSQKSDLDKMLRAAELGGWTDQEKKNIKDQMDNLRDIAKGLSIAAAEVIKDNRASGTMDPKLIGSAFDMQNYGDKFGNNTGPGSGNGGRTGGGFGGSNPNPTNPAVDAGLARIQDIIDRVTRYQAGLVNGVASGINKGDLKQDSTAIREEFRRIMADTTITDSDKADYAKNSSTAQNKITSALKQQSDAMKNFTNMIVGAITTFGVGSAIQKFAINDPYQYGFKPAMSAMGTTGVMGQAMSTAMSAQKGFQVERDQAGMQMGMGLMATGGLTSKLIGGALMAGGALGVDSKIYDSIAGNLGGVDSKTVYERSLATQFMKPDQFIASGEARRGAAMAIGGSVEGGNGSFGAYYNDAARQSKTGSAMGDRMLSQGYMGLNLNSVGMSADEGLKLAGSIGTSVNGLSGNESRLNSLTNYAAINSKLTGTTAESMVGNFSTISSMGIGNIQQTMDKTEGAVSKNGVLDSFASNVLVPGLLKVSQSLALKNVGQSAEKLNDGVLQLYRGISVGMKDTQFGKLVASNPDMIGQLLQGLGGATQSMGMTVQGNYFMQSMGLNPLAYAQGRGSTAAGLEETSMAVLKKYGFNSSSFNANGQFKNSQEGLIAQQVSGKLGVDFQAYSAVLAGYANGSIKQGDGKKAEEVYKKNLTRTALELSNDDTTKAMKLMAEQAQAMVSSVAGMSNKILDAQSMMKNFITSGALSAAAKNGIDAILKEMGAAIKQARGGTPDSSGNTGNAATNTNLNTAAAKTAAAFQIPSSAVAADTKAPYVDSTASSAIDTNLQSTFNSNAILRPHMLDAKGNIVLDNKGKMIPQNKRDDLAYVRSGKASIAEASHLMGNMGRDSQSVSNITANFRKAHPNMDSADYSALATKLLDYYKFQDALRVELEKKEKLSAGKVTTVPTVLTGVGGPVGSLSTFLGKYVTELDLKPARSSVYRGVETLLDSKNDTALKSEANNIAALLGGTFSSQIKKTVADPNLIQTVQNNYRDKINSEKDPAKKKTLMAEAEEFRRLGAKYNNMVKKEDPKAEYLKYLIASSVVSGNGTLNGSNLYKKNSDFFSPISGEKLPRDLATNLVSGGLSPVKPVITKPVIKPKAQPTSVINNGNGDFTVHIKGNNMAAVKKAIHDSLNAQAVKNITAHKPSSLV